MSLLRSSSRARAAYALLLVFLCAAPALRAQALSEAQIKAGFLYNFAKYIEWPAESFAHKDTPMTFCVLGRHPFGTAVDGLSAKSVHGRPIAVRRIASGGDDFRACHVLFISDSEQRQLVPILRGLQGALLTVSDIDGFIDVGGGIGLVAADERIQFEINLGTLQRASLRASSQLLKLARNVGSRRGRN